MKWATMANGEDWLLRPVLKGMCRYESIVDGSLSITDFAIMNHALDVMEENERLVMKESYGGRNH